MIEIKKEGQSEVTKHRQDLKNSVEVCIANETPDDSMSNAHLKSESNVLSSVVQF